MEDYEIITIIGLAICAIVSFLGYYDVRYKGKCILHNWEYKFDYGEYWRYTGTFLKYNRRHVCKKCGKEVPEKESCSS